MPRLFIGDDTHSFIGTGPVIFSNWWWTACGGSETAAGTVLTELRLLTALAAGLADRLPEEVTWPRLLRSSVLSVIWVESSMCPPLLSRDSRLEERGESAPPPPPSPP